MAQERFEVRPFYTCGSPAMVSEYQARRVAKEELQGFERTLEGVYGETAVRRAHERGLGNIVYRWFERGSKIHIKDLITGEETVRKTFPPKVGSSIFSLHPDDVKRGMFVYLADGSGATLIDPVRYDKPELWMARVERGSRTVVEQIDVTQAMSAFRPAIALESLVLEERLI